MRRRRASAVAGAFSPRAFKAPGYCGVMPEASPTWHCHQCGWTWPLQTAPGRSDACHGCGADVKVCLNCVSYDPRAAHQCRDRRADPVADKHLANFCEYFEFKKRLWYGAADEDQRTQDAREKLKKLFGD